MWLIQKYNRLSWSPLRSSVDCVETGPHSSVFRASIICFSDMGLVVRKPAFCICENKDADQLRSNCAADKRLCFRYTDNTIPLPPKSEISSLYTSSVAVQPGLCWAWSETPKTGFFTTRLNYSACQKVLSLTPSTSSISSGIAELLRNFKITICRLKYTVIIPFMG